MVRGRVPNPDRKLLPGMFANADVLAGEPKQVVTVPRTAVTYSLYGDSVWLVQRQTPTAAPPATADVEHTSATGTATAAESKAPAATPAEPEIKVERRFVRVGPSQGDRVAILEGIKVGEEVVTGGQLKLQPGATIKIDNKDALKPPARLPKQ
jgi:multidrug efflux pump subunit AcrA (membrane-fusion protein)